MHKIQHIKLFKVNSRDASRDNLNIFVFDLERVISDCLVVQFNFLRLLPNSIEVY